MLKPQELLEDKILSLPARVVCNAAMGVPVATPHECCGQRPVVGLNLLD